MDPWVLARNLAATLLLDNQTALNRVYGSLRARDVKSLASLGQILDSEYQESEINGLLAERQVASLFKKNDAFACDTACTEAARVSFVRAERKCRITNKRLDYYYTRRGRLPVRVERWLSRMERDIADLLGDVDAFVPGLPGLVRLTNGATEDRPRRRAYPFLKISGKLRAPRAAIPHIGNLLLEMGVDLSSCKFKATEENSVVLVPKNWKTHRTIAKEPTHSLPFQLALDSFLKKKLVRWGVDLSSQAKNQEMARLGSLDGSLATLDLEMASDTLSFNTVAWLLPVEWRRIFDSFRSSSYRAPWGAGKYAKYSSMGNGYTFTLETLIFTAACRAVGSSHYAVYGDDIVCETHKVAEVIELLRFLGFTVNKEKSFVNPASRFRESCGLDYYNGRRVTPFYLRELPKLSDYSSVSHVVNGLVAVSWPGPLWDYLAKLVVQLKLRLVPWNEDTRSGVFVTPHAAWVTKKLRTDHKPTRKGRPNPFYGSPVFDGYGQVQDVRKTYGWRSLLLWHICAGNGGVTVSAPVPMRTSALLLAARARHQGVATDRALCTSEVTLRSRYVHKTCRYDPKHEMTPSILFLWDTELGLDRPGAVRRLTAK